MEVGLKNSWEGQNRIWPLVISVIVVYYFFRPMSTQLSIIIFSSSFSSSKMVIKESKNNWLLTRPAWDLLFQDLKLAWKNLCRDSFCHGAFWVGGGCTARRPFSSPFLSSSPFFSSVSPSLLQCLPSSYFSCGNSALQILKCVRPPNTIEMAYLMELSP